MITKTSTKMPLQKTTIFLTTNNSPLGINISTWISDPDASIHATCQKELFHDIKPHIESITFAAELKEDIYMKTSIILFKIITVVITIIDTTTNHLKIYIFFKNRRKILIILNFCISLILFERIIGTFNLL